MSKTMAHGMWREHMSSATAAATPEVGTKMTATIAAQRGIAPVTPPTTS